MLEVPLLIWMGESSAGRGASVSLSGEKVGAQNFGSKSGLSIDSRRWPEEVGVTLGGWGRWSVFLDFTGVNLPHQGPDGLDVTRPGRPGRANRGSRTIGDPTVVPEPTSGNDPNDFLFRVEHGAARITG